MRALSQLAHQPGPKKQRVETMHLNMAEHAAIDSQRDRLRPTTILNSNKVDYNQIEKSGIPQPLPKPTSKKPPPDPIFKSRLAALAHRLETRHPTRYDHDGCRLYRQVSIQMLKDYYPNSTAPKYASSAHFSFCCSGSISSLCPRL